MEFHLATTLKSFLSSALICSYALFHFDFNETSSHQSACAKDSKGCTLTIREERHSTWGKARGLEDHQQFSFERAWTATEDS